MNDTIDIRGNTVKNIVSDLNKTFTGTSLKDDSISTIKPCSQLAFQTLTTAWFLFNDLVPLWRTQMSFRTTVSNLEVAGKESVNRKTLKTRSKGRKFWKSLVILSVRPNVNTGDVQWHRLLKCFNWDGVQHLLYRHTEGRSAAWCYWTCCGTEQRWDKRKERKEMKIWEARYIIF